MSIHIGFTYTGHSLYKSYQLDCQLHYNKSGITVWLTLKILWFHKTQFYIASSECMVGREHYKAQEESGGTESLIFQSPPFLVREDFFLDSWNAQEMTLSSLRPDFTVYRQWLLTY